LWNISEISRIYNRTKKKVPKSSQSFSWKLWPKFSEKKTL
jgi:hypothetical protein